jgi:N4-gp56 family major capsid protein
MGKTAFTTANALTKKAWDERLFRDSQKEAYFSKFMGTSSDSLVQVKDKFTKEKGDNVTFGIRMRLTSTGFTSGQSAEGNEDKLTTYSDSVSLEEYFNAVRDSGPLDRQRAMFSIDEESKAALKTWMAEKIDQLAFTQIFNSPSKIFYRDSSAGAISTTATAATAKAALSATYSLITPKLISAIKTWSLTGGNRGQTPLRPIRINGKNYFVMLMHPDSMYDIKNDSTFAQARREALERGKDNPIFSGSEAIWDGVVIHEHENCPIATDAGAGSVAWSKAIFMGAQSLIWAWGKHPETVQKEFDYGREHGFGIGMLAGVKKPTFNSKDYGSVQVYLARTNIAGL